MKTIFLIGLLFIGVAVAQDAAEPAAAAPAPPPVAPVAPQPAGGPPAQGPMYAVHDFASGAMQDRMKLKNGEKCDIDFGTKLEVVVNEMEKNKEGSEELATKLKNQFKELMDGQSDKKLCLKESWCDLGACKVRGPGKPKPVIKGRGMSKGRAAEGEPAGPASDSSGSTEPDNSGSTDPPGTGSTSATGSTPAPTDSKSTMISGGISCVLFALPLAIYY